MNLISLPGGRFQLGDITREGGRHPGDRVRASSEELVDTVLENGTRRRIYLHLLANPGAHYRGILRALGVGNGTLMYHLCILDKAKVIRVRRSGRRALYYPMVVAPGPLDGGPAHDMMEMIARSPGISDREMSAETSRSVRWVRANLAALEEASLIGIRRTEGIWRCYLLLPERTAEAAPLPEKMYHSEASI